MTPTELRRRVAESAELIVEAAGKQVEGMSHLLQTVLAENKDLHAMLCAEQAASARHQMECLSKDCEIRELDNTIVALITPRRLK